MWFQGKYIKISGRSSVKRYIDRIGLDGTLELDVAKDKIYTDDLVKIFKGIRVLNAVIRRIIMKNFKLPDDLSIKYSNSFLFIAEIFMVKGLKTIGFVDCNANDSFLTIISNIADGKTGFKLIDDVTIPLRESGESRLKTLILDGNIITSSGIINFFENRSSLLVRGIKTLSVQNNKIGFINFFASGGNGSKPPPHLKDIYLHGNKIRDIKTGKLYKDKKPIILSFPHTTVTLHLDDHANSELSEVPMTHLEKQLKIIEQVYDIFINTYFSVGRTCGFDKKDVYFTPRVPKIQFKKMKEDGLLGFYDPSTNTIKLEMNDYLDSASSYLHPSSSSSSSSSSSRPPESSLSNKLDKLFLLIKEGDTLGAIRFLKSDQIMLKYFGNTLPTTTLIHEIQHSITHTSHNSKDPHIDMKFTINGKQTESLPYDEACQFVYGKLIEKGFLVEFVNNLKKVIHL